MVEKGQILTPDKKYLLIDELRDELSKLGNVFLLKSDERVTAIKNQLNTVLEKLINKRGVVTPSETDEVLEKLNESKRIRLGNDFATSIKSAGLYLVLFAAIGTGIYFYTKSKR